MKTAFMNCRFYDSSQRARDFWLVFVVMLTCCTNSYHFISTNMEASKSVHPVQAYFSYSTENNISNCKLCKQNLKGRHSSNLLRHVKSLHRRIYDNILPVISKYHQNRIDKEKSVSATFNLAEVTKALVSLVTIDGRPYSILNDVGMKKPVAPISQACANNGFI